jgi:RHS repeat-associated protein
MCWRCYGLRGGAHTQCYEYDYLKRLTQAWTPAGTSGTNCDAAPAAGSVGGAAPYWLSWTYDTTGNRLTETLHDTGGDTTTTYTHPAAGGPRPHTVTEATTTGPGGSSLDTYAYDQVGNLAERIVGGDTQILDWDTEGNLATVTEGSDVSEYVYDVDGNRLVARDPEGSTLYLPGGSELRYDNATQTATCTRYYTHLDTMVAVRTPGELTWVVTDHHNTAEVMIANADLSAQHRRTTPFGDTRGADPAWWAGDKGFVGGTLDPTGLVHIGAREYDPTLGRFISVDPIIDVNDPQQMHGYAYGNNAPPTISDPTGLWGLGDAWDAAKSVGNTVKSTAETVSGAVASGASAVGGAVADFAVDQWNTIKEDPLKFATEVAVGVAVGALVAATCAAPPGIGCAVGVGIVAGMAAAGAGYGVDVGQGEKEFSVGELATEMAIGGIVGGATAGLGKGLSSGFKRVGGKLIDKFRRGCNSFVPGTAVAMADGTSKPIEDVELGDQVLATDPEAGETTAEDVVATIDGNGDKILVDITVAASGTITATDEHPFWVVDAQAGTGGWTAAADIQPGSHLLTVDGATVTVEAVRVHHANTAVHNLTVSGVHTYHVAESEILTHNQKKRCPAHGPGFRFELPDGKPMFPCNYRGPNCPTPPWRTEQPVSSGLPHPIEEPRPGVGIPGALHHSFEHLADDASGAAALAAAAAYLAKQAALAAKKRLLDKMRRIDGT